VELAANRVSLALESAAVLVKQKEAEAIEMRAKAEAMKAASLQKEKEADVLDERTKSEKFRNGLVFVFV